jgi:glycosyltransferase involved in cell wall biosynthesis
MKIFIEGSSVYQKRTGVGQYTKRIFENLIFIDKKNKYTLFAFLFAKKEPRAPIESPNLSYKYIKFMPGKIYNKLLKNNIKLNIDILLNRKPDLIIFPNFVAWPTSKKTRVWSIIYDASYLEHPEYSDKKNRDYLIKFVGKTVERSEKIITISENAKKEIENHYPSSKNKIEIISPAVDHKEYFPKDKTEITTVIKKYGIDKNYILYTGTLEPRKNIVGILNAYNKLTEKLKGEYQLVLAGGKGWLDDEIEEKLEELKELNIIRTGYVADEDLPALYSGASVFVYPSFYEGFGMPPLEAMACGTPVITSNNSSLPEVVGNAGIMIDANDTSALAKNIEKVLISQKMQSEMSKKGLKQAKKFSWEKSAKKMLKIIKTKSD